MCGVWCVVWVEKIKVQDDFSRFLGGGFGCIVLASLIEGRFLPHPDPPPPPPPPPPSIDPCYVIFVSRNVIELRRSASRSRFLIECFQSYLLFEILGTRSECQQYAFSLILNWHKIRTDCHVSMRLLRLKMPLHRVHRARRLFGARSKTPIDDPKARRGGEPL